jgi:PAS domain S-box-containing protein
MKPKILLVDDDLDILSVATSVFTRVNYHVTAASCLAEALVQVTAQKFDLVITDFRLGDGLGSDLIITVRKEQPGVPVIVISGCVQDLPDWLLGGPLATRVMPKPFSFSSLIEATKKELGLSPESLRIDGTETPWPIPVALPMAIEAMVHQIVNQESIVAVTDRKGAIIYANDRFCTITGYSRSELIGQNHRLLKSGQHPPIFYKQIWATILAGRTWQGEICNKAKDGHLYYVDTTIAPLREEGVVTHFLSLRTDVTERKKLQLDLAEQDKREHDERRLLALGKMTDGVLHDLNNILTGVIGMAEEETGPRSAQMKDAVGRMMQLTRRLRDYTSGLPAKAAWFRLAPEMWCACSLARYRVGTPHNLVISHFPETVVDCEIWGNEGQILEVILNLLVNAIEAASNAAAPEICIQTRMEENRVVVTIEDNGPGVPEAIVPTLFDLYSSTKGRGRGLGLSISRQIIVAHNGSLRLENPGGHGTGARFRIELSARLVSIERHAPEAPPPGLKRFVLVSEDDPDVLRLIERSVRDLGLSVMLTHAGAEIPALVAHAGGTLAAAVIDSCASDQEEGLLASLRRASPRMPVLLISALLMDRGRIATRWGEVETLPKPFDSAKFAEALQFALATAPPPAAQEGS